MWNLAIGPRRLQSLDCSRSSSIAALWMVVLFSAVDTDILDTAGSIFANLEWPSENSGERKLIPHHRSIGSVEFR